MKIPDVPGMLKSIHWGFLKSKAIPFDDISVNRFYLLALQDDKKNVQIVDIKVRSIVEELNPVRKVIKIHDGKNVESLSSLEYKVSWVICEANISVTRTSENITKVHKAIVGLTDEEMQDIIKKISKGPFGPGIPNIYPGGVHPGVIGPGIPNIYPGVIGPGTYPGPSYPTNPFGPKIGTATQTNSWGSQTIKIPSGDLAERGTSGGSFSSNTILVSNTLLTCASLDTNLEDAPDLFGDLVKQI